MRRKGHTFRIHDFKRLTVGIDPNARGGCYSPELFAYWRSKRKASRQLFRLRIPHVKFMTGLRFKQIGGLLAYRLIQRCIYAIAR